MRKPHLFVDQTLCPGDRFRLPESTAHHVARVIRMRMGQELNLFNNTGSEYNAEITVVDRGRVEVLVGDCVSVDRESKLDITLVQGVSRGQHMDYTVQKAVELGIRRIVPVFTEYGNVHLDGRRLEGKLAHWHGLIINACEQCGRNRLPVLEPPAKIDDWIAGDRNRIRLILHPGRENRLSDQPRPQETLSLLSGPEGGFSEAEVELALSHGYVPISLGPRVLRTETAAVAGISVCQALWGDLA